MAPDGAPAPAGADPGVPELSNAELGHLIEQALVRFRNWRLEAELNPNPRMVHSLANILSLVDALADSTQRKMQYSYKELLSGMARLVDDTARLNNTVVRALDDDSVSRAELQAISDKLVALVNSAMRLVRLTQASFADGEARAELKLVEGPLVGAAPPPEEPPAEAGLGPGEEPGQPS